MLDLLLAGSGDTPLNVLCLGAHSDDIEIGCGATLLTLFRSNSNVNVYWQVFCSSPERAEEGAAGASVFCAKAASLEVNILDFRDGFLPYSGQEVKEQFEACKRAFEPDIVFTHFREDRHQDHRQVSDLTWNTFRDHLILEYEIPKWDGDLGRPNTYVAVEQAVAEQKIALLMSVYATQKTKSWFTEDLFYSMLRLRGMECNADSGLAEAFYSRKLALKFSS